MTSGNKLVFLTPVSTVGHTLPSGFIPRYKPLCEADCKLMLPSSGCFSTMKCDASSLLPYEKRKH